METNEIKKLAYLKKLTARNLSTLKSSNDNTGSYAAQIKLSNYSELGCVIAEILKLCIVALDYDAHRASNTIKTSPINVALILEMVLEMFPTDEMEILDEIYQMFIANPDVIGE
ncbi:hypothetical protein [Flavobacterium johnsoniae]|jgi:hypothetical protein|uniref:hypothetical protein n=1 Tax=Flavobacterium johnsoniae TaxID=986 RepID=UPI0011EF49FE|nr:hypothetical protein [Flavobacterium johnsoniae]